jgi:stress-induced morphogen
MAPQLDVAQHILINTLLKEEFETKLIASEASCSVCAV